MTSNAKSQQPGKILTTQQNPVNIINIKSSSQLMRKPLKTRWRKELTFTTGIHTESKLTPRENTLHRASDYSEKTAFSIFCTGDGGVFIPIPRGRHSFPETAPQVLLVEI